GFDLNDDGLIDRADISVWVNELSNTWLGDANLDGRLNSADLVLVFQAGKFEQDVEALWHEGDWTGDLRFDSRDFIASFEGCWEGQSGGDCGPRELTTVPEPSRMNWAMVVAVLWLSRRLVCFKNPHCNTRSY
ncbi:MAG: hypothetical protein KDA87_03295, partial [Planctomycetales bacterium]|nr:hypothetical protein [Planctomycetales bacterium]